LAYNATGKPQSIPQTRKDKAHFSNSEICRAEIWYNRIGLLQIDLTDSPEGEIICRLGLF
jgi:hypothetical protein